MQTELDQLCKNARACTICQSTLPLEPKPIFQAHTEAKILIASQAPGSIAHSSGVPFMDKSGERLRDWMGISEEVFYDPKLIAIVPIGFCYPGKANSGDLPPTPQCALQWQASFMALLPNIKLKLFIGLHSQRWHLGNACKKTLTQTVKDWREYTDYDSGAKPVVKIPLPHPSPRNNIWLAKNEWFVLDVLPSLKANVADLVTP